MTEGRLGTSGHPYQKSGMGEEEEGVALWLPFVVGRSGESCGICRFPFGIEEKERRCVMPFLLFAKGSGTIVWRGGGIDK